jgi:hypothetical protein
LRALNGVELWQVEELRKQDPRTPIIRYMVVRGGSEASFNRPQEAWRYFQGLSGAPDKDLRPERPPIDEAFLEHPSKRTIRGAEGHQAEVAVANHWPHAFLIGAGGTALIGKQSGGVDDRRRLASVAGPSLRGHKRLALPRSARR